MLIDGRCSVALASNCTRNESPRLIGKALSPTCCKLLSFFSRSCIWIAKCWTQSDAVCDSCCLQNSSHKSIAGKGGSTMKKLFLIALAFMFALVGSELAAAHDVAA